MAGAANLAELTERGVLSGVVARERTVAVLPAFESLLPGAVLQRGSIVGCEGTAAVSLALALAAGPSQHGAWVAVAGLPDLGVAAASELGVVPSRVVMLTEPTPAFDEATLADALAAMIDGFDVVLLGPGTARLRPTTTRRLAARVQARGAVIITIGANSAFVDDVRCIATHSTWHGIGDGCGVASGRRAEIQVAGRRVPHPRSGELWLPAATGRVGQIEPMALCPTG